MNSYSKIYFSKIYKDFWVDTSKPVEVHKFRKQKIEAMIAKSVRENRLDFKIDPINQVSPED